MNYETYAMEEYKIGYEIFMSKWCKWYKVNNEGDGVWEEHERDQKIILEYFSNSEFFIVKKEIIRLEHPWGSINFFKYDKNEYKTERIIIEYGREFFDSFGFCDNEGSGYRIIKKTIFDYKYDCFGRRVVD